MPVLPSWPSEPLWDQFAALLPERPEYHDLSIVKDYIDNQKRPA
ncbi:hypothetical protein OG352_32950 [Streptomyces sp. NBC_01485]|nr:hypothetical protein [Streptomyces sp. NBC_01485]